MMKKGIIKSIPWLNNLFTCLYKKIGNFSFPGSKNYWENRYQKGGDSGGGSYKHLAEFKARILNSFVEEHKVEKVIEFGCGDGNQLTLAKYPAYIGLDVSQTAISACIEKFKTDLEKSFFLYDSLLFADHHKVFQADLAMSLDVIYHLVEDEIFEKYMRDLFASSEKYVIIYSSNFDGEQNAFCRSREFTRFVADFLPHWRLKETIKNEFPFDPENPDPKGTSWSDFFIYEKID